MSIDEYKKILEVDSKAGFEEIRANWLRLQKVWHPDRFQGADDSLKSLATRKIQEINHAYTTLRQILEAPPRVEEKTISGDIYERQEKSRKPVERITDVQLSRLHRICAIRGITLFTHRPACPKNALGRIIWDSKQQITQIQFDPDFSRFDVPFRLIGIDVLRRNASDRILSRFRGLYVNNFTEWQTPTDQLRGQPEDMLASAFAAKISSLTRSENDNLPSLGKAFFASFGRLSENDAVDWMQYAMHQGSLPISSTDARNHGGDRDNFLRVFEVLIIQTPIPV